MKDLFLILDNVRSTYNVGAIFRTADAVGVKKIFLCGVTPAPVDRFGRKNERIAKSSLGAEDSVEWEYCESASNVVRELHEKGVLVYALEQRDSSVDFREFKPEFPCALVVGAEVEGVSQEILETADTVIEIPMKGMKESLNVSVATGIALYALFKEN